MSIIYLRRIQSQAALVSASPATRRGAGLSLRHQEPHLSNGSPSPALPEGLAERQLFGSNRGRAQTPPTGRTGRVKEGQIWAPKSLPQKPGGPGLPVFVDGPLEADWPVCRGLISPSGDRPLTARRPAPRGGRCRRSPAPVTASLEQGSGRPKIVLGRPILVRGFSPEGPLRSAGTSPAPRPRRGSRA